MSPSGVKVELSELADDALAAIAAASGEAFDENRIVTTVAGDVVVSVAGNVVVRL